MKNITYEEIYEIIKNKKVISSDVIHSLDKNENINLHSKDNGKNNFGVAFTIEFYPEEGMYHYDGHRACGVSLAPEQTRKYKNICPVCKKPLTIGVMNRVDEIADRPPGFKPAGAAPFKKLVELDKIIAEAMDIKSRSSNKVQAEYNKLIKQGGNELNILLNISLKELEHMADAAVAEGIRRVREGRLNIKPGFDGQYGEIKIFSEQEKKKNKQKSLFE